MNASQPTPEARRIIADSAEWRLISALLSRPTRRQREEIAALASEIDRPLLKAAAAQSKDAGEGLYLAVLGPGGPVSPREVGYRGLGDPGKILSDLGGFYSAFQYAPRSEDPPDHLAVESGFVGYLLLKAAYARIDGQSSAEETCCEALTSFRESHLNGFVEPFRERLRQIGVGGYLLETATVLVEKLGEIGGPVVSLRTD